MPITFVYGGAVVPLPDVATHTMALVQMPPMDTASQLRAILPELEWQSAGITVDLSAGTDKPSVIETTPRKPTLS